jgi:hypothetical protein
MAATTRVARDSRRIANDSRRFLRMARVTCVAIRRNFPRERVDIFLPVPGADGGVALACDVPSILMADQALDRLNQMHFCNLRLTKINYRTTPQYIRPGFSSFSFKNDPYTRHF